MVSLSVIILGSIFMYYVRTKVNLVCGFKIKWWDVQKFLQYVSGKSICCWWNVGKD